MRQPNRRPHADTQVAQWGRALWLPFALPLAALVLALASMAKADGHMITSHGISTFGELKYPADFPHLEYVNPDAPKGGEMSVWAFGSYDSMNPYSVEGRAAALASSSLETLLVGTADEIGATYGLLAESLVYPQDRSEVTFNLRPEARFSDGSPLTAEDVKFSFEVFRDKGLSSFRTQLQRKVASVEVLGLHQIRFVFNEGIPTRDLPAEMGALPILSKAHYEANELDLEKASMTPFLGSGPYVRGDMDEGRSITYVRNPEYWGANLPINVGQNNFDSLRIEYFADYDSAFVGFTAGAYRFRNEASSKTWATGYTFPAVENGWVVKAELPHGRKAPNQSFVFNLRRDKFQDPRVREAIGLLFNFEWSNEKLFYGIYDRGSSFWTNSTLEAKGAPTAEELALLEPLADILPDGAMADEPFSWPNGGERQVDRRTLRRASALLDDAGWMVGDDGMRRNANGEMLTVELLNDSQTFDRVLLPYVENMRRAGIDASMNRIDNAQMSRRERPPEYDFDIVTNFMQTGYEPGTELRQRFGSETADTSVFNQMGLKSPAVDAMIEHLIGATSQAEMETAISALDRVLRAEKFTVPQWFKGADTVAYYDIYGYPDPLPPYALGNLSFWWYDADKAARLEAAGAL